MNEEWRAVVGAEGWYEVSNEGRVRRVRPGKATFVGRILKPTKRRNRRLTVDLRMDGRSLSKEVHALVIAAFVGPRPDGKEINHIDGNPGNNCLANLEYVTRSENMAHAYRLGLVTLDIGEDHHLAKLTNEQIIVIRHCTAADRLLARVFGVSRATIKQIKSLKTWKHVG